MATELEILDARLLQIHEMWKNPKWQWVSTPEDFHTQALTCFKVPALPLYHRWRMRDEYRFTKDDIDWWSISENVEEDGDKICFVSYTMFDMLFEHSFWVRIFPQLTSKIIVQLLSSKFQTRYELMTFLCSIDGDDFGNFIRECGQYEYSWKYIQDTVNSFLEEKLPLKYPYIVVNNETELDKFCDEVITANLKSVEDYRKGKINSINHLKGQVMKLTKGQADIKMVSQILEKKLKQ